MCFSFTLILLPHSQHFWHQTCWGYSYTKQFCETSWVSCNSDTIYLIKDSVPWHFPWLQMPVTSSRSPGYPQFLSNLATDQRFPWPPPWIRLFARTAHRTQGNIYLLYQSIKRCDKGYRWTEIRRVRSGRVLSTGASVSMELRMCHLPGTWMCSPTWKLFGTNTFDILWGLSHVGMVNY